MSLDTVLRIGKIYRNSNEYGLDEHRYVNKFSDDIKNFSKNKDEQGHSVQTVIYNIPVLLDEAGNWHIQVIERSVIDLLEEDRIKGMRYLNYKTSDKDSLKKYFFGDITYATSKKDGKMVEAGSYRLEGKSSFYRGKDELAGLTSKAILSFRRSFEENILSIEGLLRSAPAVALHFDFQGQSWYSDKSDMDAINQKLVEEFAAKRTLPNGREVVSLSKTIFKTIKSPLYDREKNTFGDPDGIGGCVPEFRNTAGYKIRYFESLDEVIDLFYAVSTAEKKFAKRIKDVGILALPRAENLTARQLNAFFGSNTEYDETEEKLVQDQQSSDLFSDFDELFERMLDNDLPDVDFDIIFMKPPGMSTPSVDLVEISNIRKSLLREVHEDIRKWRNHWQKEASERMPGLKKSLGLSVTNSFQQLLDNRTKDQKKYQSHLLKVLPQIYSDTYYRDPILLSLLIEQVEYGIRQDKAPFNFLKYYFYFLTSIQKHGEMTMNTITNSSSYRMGHCLGVMSKPFAAWRKDKCPIKSFEKGYVGNLSRRILSPTDTTNFANFLNEKLTIHEQYYPEQREAFQQFLAMLKSFEGNSKEKYDRHNCALGFFEGYHSPIPDKTKEDEAPEN